MCTLATGYRRIYLHPIDVELVILPMFFGDSLQHDPQRTSCSPLPPNNLPRVRTFRHRDLNSCVVSRSGDDGHGRHGIGGDRYRSRDSAAQTSAVRDSAAMWLV